MTSNPRISLTAGSARRCPMRMPDIWEPPVPAFCSDLSALPRAVVACLGVQSLRQAAPVEVAELRERVRGHAARIEQAWYTDPEGYRNDVLVCYWPDEAMYHNWANGEFAAWWSAPARLAGDMGYWREVFSAPEDHRETLFSGDDRPAGLAALGTRLFGPVLEHGYWGGARDRIPVSASHELDVERQLEPHRRTSFGRRLRVQPREHVCVIRSAQDSTDCTGREADLYQGRVYPVLMKGMNYLRDHASETGCFSCRFMHELEADGTASPRSFALAHFVSLGHLERWAASHPTHLAIFEEFLAMATELGPAMRLRLWHEVYVLPRGAGRFEYLNCHPGTGLLPFEEPVEAS
jgi:aldoxime dehydratase